MRENSIVQINFLLALDLNYHPKKRKKQSLQQVKTGKIYLKEILSSSILIKNYTRTQKQRNSCYGVVLRLEVGNTEAQILQEIKAWESTIERKWGNRIRREQNYINWNKDYFWYDCLSVQQKIEKIQIFSASYKEVFSPNQTNNKTQTIIKQYVAHHFSIRHVQEINLTILVIFGYQQLARLFLIGQFKILAFFSKMGIFPPQISSLILKQFLTKVFINFITQRLRIRISKINSINKIFKIKYLSSRSGLRSNVILYFLFCFLWTPFRWKKLKGQNSQDRSCPLDLRLAPLLIQLPISLILECRTRLFVKQSDALFRILTKIYKKCSQKMIWSILMKHICAFLYKT